MKTSTDNTEGIKMTKKVVRSQDKAYVARTVGSLEKRGWKKKMEPKQFAMLDGKMEWVCVMENDTPPKRTRKNNFNSDFFY
jgi:hypothetical protein